MYNIHPCCQVNNNLAQEHMNQRTVTEHACGHFQLVHTRKVLNLIPAMFSEKEGEKTLHDLIMSSEQKKSLYISPDSYVLGLA